MGTTTPTTPTVTLGSDMSPELVADVANALRDMGVEVKTDEVDRTPRETRVIVVVSPKGGSGKTAISSNLATALAERHPGRVVAVDLDVQFGDLSLALSLSPKRNLAQLARSNKIDPTTVKLHLTSAPGEAFVLAGAANPVDADSVHHTHVTTVMPYLIDSFDYVVVDTSAGLDERTLAALDFATDLLMVSSLDVTSIRSLRTVRDTVEQLGIPARQHLVLNRSDSKVGLAPSDAEDVMGMEITCSIPSNRNVPLSLNLGTPVVTGEPKSSTAKAMFRLADLFAPVETKSGRKGWRR